MVEFINRFTGSKMQVADERAEEYKAAGHKPVAPASAKPATKEPEAKKTKKK